LTSIAMPAKQYSGEITEAVWLPNQRVAKAWAEYVQTGAVGDSSPPPAPFAVRATAKPDKTIEITWQARADFESGLAGFVVQRDNEELARVPGKPAGRFGRPLFQAMSYHDTPESPLPEMRFVDTSPRPGVRHQYRIVAINSVGLRSAPSAASAW